MGRKSLGVRVCSCPRRDLQKDEREYKFYNGYNMREEPPQKKRLIKHTQKNHHSEIDENVRNVMSFHNYQVGI